jgi:hypothetical protein
LFSLAEILEILQTVHEEGLSGVYAPADSNKTEFGFGRTHGILVTVMRIKTLLQEAEEIRDEKQRLREEM